MRTDVWDKVKPERDDKGRYLIIPKGGKKPVAHTRVTTIAGKLDDRYHLERWGYRSVARGLVVRPDLYARVAATRPDDKDTLNRLCEQAIEASKASAGANYGTAMHEALAQVEAGEDLEMPERWQPDIVACQKALAEAGATLVPGMIERVVVLPDIKVAGTFDRLYHLPQVSDLPIVADLKTGATLDLSQPSMSSQLAMYSRADSIYDPATKTHEPMPAVDQKYGLIIHLPVGQARCELRVIALEPGWEAVQHALWARKWCYRKDLLRPLSYFETTDLATSRRTFLVGRITALRDEDPSTLEVLAERWPDGVPTFRQTETHSQEELDLIALAVSSVEADRRAPFGPLDPGDEAVPGATRYALAARLDAIPPDIPTLDMRSRLGHLTVRDLPRLEACIAEVERATAERVTRLASIVTQVSSDDELVTVFLAAAGINGQAATGRQVDDAAALLEAMAAQVVHFDQDDRGWFLTVDPEALSKILLDAHGGRAPALTFCKEVAKVIGRPSPRSFAGMMTDPILAAYAVTYQPPD